MFKKIIFFFVVIVFIENASCKKYPDGPLISLNSKMERICRTWDVAYFSIDGNDSTDYLRHQPFYGKYTFHSASKNGSTYCSYSAIDPNYFGEGKWGFINNKGGINVNFSFNPNYTGHIGPYRLDIGNGQIVPNVNWDIRRLTEKNLWLQTTYNGKVYFVKFNGY